MTRLRRDLVIAWACVAVLALVGAAYVWALAQTEPVTRWLSSWGIR